jgi:hypothetical protein
MSKAIEMVDKDKTLIDNPSITRKQLEFLTGHTPKNQIYKRPAKGGGEWEYVKGSWVKKVLNYVFGWNWDFEIAEHGGEGSQVWVLGKLTVRDSKNQSITKMQFGRADSKQKKDGSGLLDYGNDLKAAATDALKKCASELGVASDLYAKEEDREIKELSVKKPEEPIKNKLATDMQIETIKKMAKANKITIKVPKTFNEANKIIQELSKFK